MTLKLKEELIKTATFVSGLVGLANADLSKSSTALPKDKWNDSIIVEETPKGNKISMGIIVDVEVRSKIVAYEINSSIKALLKKNGQKLDKVNIYIRGLK